MLIPEVYAWISRLNQPAGSERKRPVVTRGEATAQAGSEDNAHSGPHYEDAQVRSAKVEYLNERRSDYNFYA